MAFATPQQLLAVEDVSAYLSTADIEQSLNWAETNILRLLNTIWYQKFLLENPQYTPTRLTATLLSPVEWQQPTIYYALAYRILPNIIDKQGINLWAELSEYHNSWEYEIRNLLQFGITYDIEGTTLRFVPDRETFKYTRLRK